MDHSKEELERAFNASELRQLPCFLWESLADINHDWMLVGTCWHTIKMMIYDDDLGKYYIVAWLSKLLNAQDCKISRHLNPKFLDAAAHFIVWPSSWPLPNPGSSRVVGTTESNWQLRRRTRRARGPCSHGWGAKMPRQKWATEGFGDMVIELLVLIIDGNLGIIIKKWGL